MSYRFRQGLSGIQAALNLIPLRLHKLRQQHREPLPVIRGNMRRVIVIQPADPMFSEAMFILRDDYFQTPGLSRQELLRQAREAAKDCAGQALPSGAGRPLLPGAMSVFALGAAAAVFALWLGGVI